MLQFNRRGRSDENHPLFKEGNWRQNIKQNPPQRKANRKEFFFNPAHYLSSLEGSE